MNHKIRKEVSGLILETMLFEIIKDGRIESFERQIMHKICTHLRINAEEFQEIKKRVQKQVQNPDIEAGAFDAKMFFGKLRALLLNVLNAEDTAFIIRKTSSLLEVEEPDFELSQLSGDVIYNLKNPNVGIRALAIQDLISSNLPNRSDLLKTALQNEKDVQLRYEIRKGIAELQSLNTRGSDKSTEQKTSDSEVQTKLSSLLQGNDLSSVRDTCIKIVREEISPLYHEVVKQQDKWNDPLIRGCALKILARFGPKYADQILKYADDEDPRIVSSCIEILEKNGDSASLAKIVSLTEHENNRVRANALKAMHNLGDETALALLERMLNSENSAYRDSATHVLVQLKITQSIPLLSELLKDENEGIKAKAFSALKEMSEQGNNEATQAINEYENYPSAIINTTKIPTCVILPTENGKTEENIADTQSRTETNFPALVSQSPKIRIEALSCLTEHSSPDEALTHIKERLRLEEEPRVISAALSALGQINGHETEKAAIFSHYLENSNDDRIRANALEGLAGLKRKADQVIFLRLLKDRCNRVVGNAIIALYESDDTAFIREIKNTIAYLAENQNRDCQLTAISCCAQLQEDYCLDCLQLIRKTTHLQSLTETIKSLPLYEKNREAALHLQQEFRQLLRERESGMSHAEILQYQQEYRSDSASNNSHKSLSENMEQSLKTDSETTIAQKAEKAHKETEIKSTQPAGFWIRTTAFGVDCAIHSLATLLAFIIIYGLLESLPAGLEEIVNFLRTVISLILFFITPWLYYAGLESGSEFETTIGKMLMGLTVLNKKQQKPSFWQAFSRFAARLPLCLIILFISFFFDDLKTKINLYFLAYAGFFLPHLLVAWGNKRGIHDRLSSCSVLKLKKPRFNPWGTFFLSWFLALFFHGSAFLVLLGVLYMNPKIPAHSENPHQLQKTADSWPVFSASDYQDDEKQKKAPAHSLIPYEWKSPGGLSS